MEELIVNRTELRDRGFRALSEALGWVNAVRFLREFDPGAGNYTEERRALLPDWRTEELVNRALRVPSRPKDGS